MARPKLSKNYFGFNKGKITEASGLTFPENSLRSSVNVDLKYDGTAQRRLGIDFEDDHVESGSVTNIDSFNVQTYLWENAGQESSTNIVVVRYSNALRFYSMETDVISDNFIAQLDISSSSKNLTESAKAPCSFATEKGYLFVVNRYMEPFYISWDGASSFTKTEITLRIRDLEGADDGLEVGERPSVLSEEHLYNLINQGWPERKVLCTRGDGTTRQFAWDEFRFRHYLSRLEYLYPSNGDNYTGVEEDTYSPIGAANAPASTSVVPKGHFVLDLFNQVRSYNISGADVVLSTTSTTERPSVIGAFQGHILYSGIAAEGTKDTVYISKSLNNIKEVGDCFSYNDPTKSLESSPLDTDGGYVKINGLGNCIAIENFYNSAIVISDTGVWSLRAADGGPFSVNNMVLSKISNSGAISKESVAVYENNIFYWGQNGIYSISKDQSGFNDISSNITEYTIQSDYLDIPTIAKKYSRSLVDSLNRKIYWFYNSSLTSNQDILYKFTDVLVMDGRTGAFYDYSIASLDSNSPFVCGGVLLKGDITAEFEEDVVVGADVVQVSAEDVYITSTASFDLTNSLKLLTMVTDDEVTYSFTFSEFKSRTFKDWYSVDNVGADYSSYMETGYDIVGDAMRDKQATYVYCYFNRTETQYVDNGSGGVEFDYPSSCLMTAKWDWTNTSTANRWGSQQQVYRLRVPYVAGGVGSSFDYSYDVVDTKNKVRGKGKSLHMRFESESGKDFQMLGVAVEYTAEGNV